MWGGRMFVILVYVTEIIVLCQWAEKSESRTTDLHPVQIVHEVK